MINSLRFSSFGNVLVSHSFLKDISTEYIIMYWQIFSFSTRKILYHFLWSLCFLIRNTLFQFISCHFFLNAFKIFSCLIPQKLDFDVLVWISWGISYLDIHSTSWLYKLCFFTKFKFFQLSFPFCLQCPGNTNVIPFS